MSPAGDGVRELRREVRDLSEQVTMMRGQIELLASVMFTADPVRNGSRKQPTVTKPAATDRPGPDSGRAAALPKSTTADLLAQRRLYPVQEAADLLGVHRTTLYNRAGEGLIQLLRIGGRTYVAADEIERYIRDAQPAGAAR